ncbi:MAG TPA: DUF4013 domain-containing protein [Aggregatilineales bacterium]|nr:DUF4013 domain-containing protein [Aggregatilineales bacterium]
MDLARAVEYLSKDPEWTPKLAITAVIGFVSLITTPLLIGLAGWAILLGYQVALIRNVRDKMTYPLPRWDDYGGYLSRGSKVLTAMFVYQLPNLIPLCCGLATMSFWRDGFFGSTLALGLFCCIGPVLIVYNLITAPMFALGMARFAEENNIVVFFQFNDLFDSIRRNLQPTIYWLVLSVVVGAVSSIVIAIPCLGWFAAPALTIPISGHLTAQFADSLETPLPGRITAPPQRRI